MSGTEVAKVEKAGFNVNYVPFGEREAITLTIDRVRQFLCTPTRSGQLPSDADVVRFAMLCKAQGLNPWVNDAYCVGYDTQDGAKFNLITSHQAFLKRAEASPQYDGMRSGVVVQVGDGEPIKREGDLVYKGETLVGGWAEVYRKDRLVPSSDALSLAVFSTGRSRWKDDPAGQICKCAEASAVRKAYPSSLSGLRCREEMDAVHEATVAAKRATVVAESGFGAGASVVEVERPGSLPDRRSCLPTHLRQDTSDTRPLVDYLVDKITNGTATDRVAIAEALPGLGIGADGMMAVIQSLSSSEPVAEPAVRERAEPVAAEPVRPEAVRSVLEAIRKARSPMSLELVVKRWSGDGAAAEYEDFGELISAAVVRKEASFTEEV